MVCSRVLADTRSSRAYGPRSSSNYELIQRRTDRFAAPVSTLLISTRLDLSYMNRDSCPSLHSSSPEFLHLALVFFDVLLLGNASLLNVPYSIRRSMLESVIHEIPGQAMIAERSVVSSGPEACMENASKNLREIWAQRIAESQEGLVLKSGESAYGDWRLPWVKVHKHVGTITLLIDGNS
jgi:hypothetical protein